MNHSSCTCAFIAATPGQYFFIDAIQPAPGHHDVAELDQLDRTSFA